MGNGTEPPSVESEPITAARQRVALDELRKFAYPVELRTLAAYVVAARENVPVDTVGDEVRERTAIRLHHIDIPVLIDARLVDYDPESRMAVRLDAHADDRYTGVESDSRRYDVA
ncbi:hypothetical protein C449_12420 [Halococcus saccharolyticus DSM 5350]|uniref:DUF7344 domain-containing protein n=1 Tax=Halococcus saccharolyticus DSM 5350 TaxID=1227455 RepID=M0MGL2_9EURY|nr:hypothetical protein C449_12420 [Halococcus saccharolyticus DSM 5350]